MISVVLAATANMPSAEDSEDWLRAYMMASCKETIMAESIINDFPSPISSARIPPSMSWRSGLFVPEIMCR